MRRLDLAGIDEGRAASEVFPGPPPIQ